MYVASGTYVVRRSDIVTSHPESPSLIGQPWSILSADWLMWSDQHGHGSQRSPWCPINSITGHILHWWEKPETETNDNVRIFFFAFLMNFSSSSPWFLCVNIIYDQRISSTLYLWKFASTSNLSALICYLTKVNFQHFIKLLLKLLSFKKAKTISI